MTRHRTLVRPRIGFTMIECLTVAAVIGVMMAIVVPRLRISPSTEVQLAGMQLAQDIDLARTRALSTRSYARVVFTTGAAPTYAGYLDTNGDSTFAQSADESVALHGWGTRALPDRIIYGRGTAPAAPGETGAGAISFANARAQFDSRGLTNPAGAAGTVYVRHANDPAEVAAVMLSPSGNVRLWIYHDGVWK